MVLGWGKKSQVREENDEEMSMDEILASIRKYVSEDQQPTQERVAERDVPSSVDEDDHSPYRREGDSRLSEQGNDGYPAEPTFSNYSQGPSFEPKNTFENSALFSAASSLERQPEGGMSLPERPVTTTMADRFVVPNSAGRVNSVDEGYQQQSQYQQPLSTIRKESVMTEPQPRQEAGLLSDATLTATSHAFAKLIDVSRSTASSQPGGAPAVTLDQLIADLARPMIQNWVDQNLSTMVENMISQEIAKITSALGVTNRR